MLKNLFKKVMSGKESDSAAGKKEAQTGKGKEGQSMAKSKPTKQTGKAAAAKKPAPAKKPVAKAQPKQQAKAPQKPAAKPAPKSIAAKPVAKDKGKVEEKKTVTAKPVAAAAKSVSSPKLKPTPTLSSAKPAPKLSARDDDGDDAPSKPVRAGLSTDLFSEEELTTFRNLLNEEKRKILAKARAATASGNIALEKDEMYDEVDLASATVEQNLTLRLLDRDRKLLAEIDHAIDKIDTGDYGFCEGTGEAIPKRRLELRPWCRHSVKYKEQLERMKKSGRGVADEDEAF
ncbi:MAG: hypothetical protein RIQ81_2443 [Pseudomonadota bacterium]